MRLKHPHRHAWPGGAHRPPEEHTRALTSGRRLAAGLAHGGRGEPEPEPEAAPRGRGKLRARGSRRGGRAAASPASRSQRPGRRPPSSEPPAQPQPVRAAAGGDVAERRWRFESGAGAMDGSGPQGQGQGQPGRAADPQELAEEAKPGEGPGRSSCGRGGCRWRSLWERVNGSARTPWLLGTRVRCQAGVCGCRLAS